MSQNLKVPFADLKQQHQSIKYELDEAIRTVVDSCAFVRGPHVEGFERKFAEAIGAEHCVSCANGTDAIYIAMRALDVQPGDEVIVPAHSWISTSQTVSQAGATVVFCDTDSDTYTLDPEDLAKKVTERTVGVIPVHLYGQPADMDPIMECAKQHNLWVVEDCAQAHLAEYKGRKVGTFGQAATFSFYPGKNLGAMGDAGAILTSDRGLADRMAMFARHGGLKKGEHHIEGINSRLDGLQAAILSVKLKYLELWTTKRNKAAQLYNELLKNVPGIVVPKTADGVSHVWHLYVIQHDRRDELAKFLADRGISTAIQYPVALPFLPAYERLGHEPQDFPVAHGHQTKILSLPIFPDISEEQIVHVVNSIKDFCK